MNKRITALLFATIVGFYASAGVADPQARPHEHPAPAKHVTRIVHHHAQPARERMIVHQNRTRQVERSQMRSERRLREKRTEGRFVRTRTETRRHEAEHRVAVRRIPVFVNRTRTMAQVREISNSRVIVRLPSGEDREFVAFRLNGTDRDLLIFRLPNGQRRTFQVIEVSRPIARRVVIFMREERREPEDELAVLRTAALNENEMFLVGPNQALMPFAVTAVEPLPGEQVAILGTEPLTPTLAPANVSFVGTVESIAGNLVNFLLPNNTTRTLADFGALPAVGGQYVVVENGQQVVGLSPAVTNFVGQVIGLDNNMATFVLPDGTMRTLVLTNTVPALGTRVAVFENGDRVERLQIL